MEAKKEQAGRSSRTKAGRRVLLGLMILGALTLGGPGCEPTVPCLEHNQVCYSDDECCSEFCNYWPEMDYPRWGLCL